MASSQYLTQHPASLSLDLTKMKVCVSPQVGVAMETTVIQRSRQWLLNKRSCLMELKSRPGSSSPAICAGSISSRAAEGEWVRLHFIKRIKTAHSALFTAHNSGRKCFVSQISG